MKGQDVHPLELYTSPLSVDVGDRFGRLAGFGGARLADLEPDARKGGRPARALPVYSPGLMGRKVRR